MKRIYMDHNATTPLREDVLEVMLPYLRGEFGNASSLHYFGIQARRAVEDHILEGKTLNGLGSANVMTGEVA